MSNTVAKVKSQHTKPVHVDSFSGGEDKGQCLQLTQSSGDSFQFVHMDRDQVQKMVAVMATWLAEQ